MFDIADNSQIATGAKIKVIGVGGGGCNAVNTMIRSGLTGVEYIVANTDSQALAANLAGIKIQLGGNVTKGLGAGANPEVGRKAAIEDYEKLSEVLDGSDMVFVTAGMGGGTGTGAAPVIARAAKDLNLLTVAVVTKPFIFEGPGRLKAAERGLEELKKYVDTSIIIPNQNLFKVANEKTTFPQAFKMADNVLMQGVRGITDLIVKPGLINLDFADIETVMKGMGKAMMGTGEAEGDKRAVMSAEAALANPLIDDYSLKGARGLLINITGGNDITLFEVDEAANKIRAEVDPSAEILVGSTFEDALDGKMRVSIVATGLGGEAAINNKPVVSMMRHINNRNNGYSTVYNKPQQSFVPNYVTQTAPQAMTNGATALDMYQETSHVAEINNQALNHMNVQEEAVSSNTSQEQNISTQNLSALNEKENAQIVEEVTSFPKLFSEDENLKGISNDKEGSSQFFKDLGHDLTDAEKADLEIPAFLRRQTN